MSVPEPLAILFFLDPSIIFGLSLSLGVIYKRCCVHYQTLNWIILCPISMDMDSKHFNTLVETLLEPKNRGTVKNPYYHEQHIHDDFIKLHPREQLRPCEDCAQPVRNRTVHYVIYQLGSKNQHWKKCCMVCGDKQVISHPFDNEEK
jgi:hypothetical protein